MTLPANPNNQPQKAKSASMTTDAGDSDAWVGIDDTIDQRHASNGAAVAPTTTSFT